MSLDAFWAIVFFAAFAAFAIISALIAVKGVGEIRVLFDHLERGASSRAAAEARRAARAEDDERPVDGGR
jgi:hypothetical protein